MATGVTGAARAAIAKRAKAAGKKPTTAGINATFAKNRARAALKRPASLDAKTQPIEKAAPGQDMRVIGPAPGDLPKGSEGLVTQGPTQAGLDASAMYEKRRVLAIKKARQAAASGTGGGTSAPKPPPDTRHTGTNRFHQGFATEEDAIAGGLNVARPPAGRPNAWGLGGTSTPPNAGSSSGGPRKQKPAIKEPDRRVYHTRSPGPKK